MIDELQDVDNLFSIVSNETPITMEQFKRFIALGVEDGNFFRAVTVFNDIKLDRKALGLEEAEGHDENDGNE